MSTRRRASNGHGTLWPMLALFVAIPAAGSIRIAVRARILLPLVAYSAMSLLAFALYAADKRRAQRGEWRISEGALHLCELAGGWPGALVAQRLLRHKTRKTTYQMAFWTIVALHQIAWLAVAFSGGAMPDWPAMAPWRWLPAHSGTPAGYPLQREDPLHRTHHAAVAASMFVIALFCCRPALCAPSVETAARIRRQIDAELAAPGLHGGVQGVVVESLRDGAVWYTRSDETLLMPASNQKLLTSSAAFALLGRDYRFVTKLVRRGSVDRRGTLHGSLFLIGGGDPLLRTADLDKLAGEVRAAGIRAITGAVFGDDSRFDRMRYGAGWSWDYLAANYAPQVSALNVDENVMHVEVLPGDRVGRPVRVRITPTEQYSVVVNRAHTGAVGSAGTIEIDREIGKNRITIDGSLPVDAAGAKLPSAGVTMESPARYAAVLLTERLRRIGVTVRMAADARPAPANGTVEIARHTGAPLIDVLHELNLRSDNLIAECLLKTLGAEKGKVGSSAEGWQAAFAWYRSVGLNPALIDVVDGSGLSRCDRVSPRFMAGLLRVMWGRPDGKDWIDTLPVAGRSGTLARRMKGTPAEANCHGKTGYIGNVSSLSGYVTTRDGEPLLYVMLMNNHPDNTADARTAQDHIAVLLASFTEKQPAR